MKPISLLDGHDFGCSIEIGQRCRHKVGVTYGDATQYSKVRWDLDKLTDMLLGGCSLGLCLSLRSTIDMNPTGCQAKIGGCKLEDGGGD